MVVKIIPNLFEVLKSNNKLSLDQEEDIIFLSENYEKSQLALIIIILLNKMEKSNA